jgi:hypothetical protein
LNPGGPEFAGTVPTSFHPQGKEHTMADIHVEKRTAVWPWILGLVLLAVLIWAFVAGRDGDRTMTPATTGQTTTTPATTTARTTTTPATAPVAGTADTWPDRTTTAGTAGTTTTYPATQTSARDMTGLTTDPIPVAAIVEQPQQYRQQTVTGVATVAEVDAARGVWIEQGGERLLVVLGDDTAGTAQAGQQQMITALRPGENVRLTGVVHDQSTAGQMGTSPQLQQRIQGEQVFLSASDIQRADQVAETDFDD